MLDSWGGPNLVTKVLKGRKGKQEMGVPRGKYSRRVTGMQGYWLGRWREGPQAKG